MASVDLVDYVDLSPYDVDAQELVDVAKADLATKLPGLVLREGTIEAVLIEALALEAAELTYVINRLPSATIEGLFLLYGITRDLGAAPTVTLRITAVDNAGYTFPAGLRARLDLGVGVDPLTFTTAAGITIAPGATTGQALATADRSTDDANGVAAGAILELLDAYPSVQLVDTTTVAAGGRDEETSTAWRTRGTARLARLSDVLSVPRHFTAAALENPAVTRAFTIDNYNSATGLVAQGFVAVAVYGVNAAVSAADKAILLADLDDRAQANLAVSVVDPTITAVEVDATVVRKAGFTDATVVANVKAALETYLSPATWPWAGTVYRNELIAVIDAVAGVERVTSITTPAADLALAGIAPLADFLNTAASVITTTA